MKKYVRMVLIAFVVAVIALGGLAYVYIAGVPITHKGLKYAEKYRDIDSVDYVHFTEEDLGEYEDIQYQVRDVKGLFRSVGSMYTVEYSAEQYEKQSAVVESLDYLQDSEIQNDDASWLMPAVKAENNGWTIRVLDTEGDESYPKQFGMIGTNDESQTMVYMYFTDLDLDYISEESGEQALEDFIEEYFNFKFK